MKLLLSRKVWIAIALLSLSFVELCQAVPSPEGRWLVNSPFFNNRPLAIIKLYIVKDRLYGQLLKVLPLNGNIKPGKIASSGPVVMFGYKEQNGNWVDGQIYEQSTARLYRSQIKLDADGRHLYVRGYKGIFYRTAKWERL